MDISRYLLALVWMAVIMSLSMDSFSAVQTGGIIIPSLHWLFPWATAAQLTVIHGLIRKSAHFTEYAILAILWFRAFATHPRRTVATAAGVAFAITVAWACADEAHQATVPTRTASPWDVALDATGGAVALAYLSLRATRGRPGAGSDLQARIERVAEPVTEQVDP
jgi:VanZ family protein